MHELSFLSVMAGNPPGGGVGSVVISVIGTIVLGGLIIGVFWYFVSTMTKAQRDLGNLLSSEEFATIATVAIGAWLVGKALKAGFAFLKDVDWDRVGQDVLLALQAAEREIEAQPSGLARLEKATSLLASRNEVEVEASAMLASATLELGLRSLARRNRISVTPDEDSLVGLAIRLGQVGVITPAEQQTIRHYAARVRNRVMHGDLGTIDSREVAALIDACRRFFATYRLN